MAGFLAYIIPMDGGAHPSHPIMLPGMPGWGAGGQPPYPSQGPGFPTHPIAPGGQPPYPSQGPGFPTHPIYIPIQPPAGTTPPDGVAPEHPIYIPVYPSQGPGFPTHPIAGVDPGQMREWLKEFLTGNLPPQPPQPTPV